MLVAFITSLMCLPGDMSLGVSVRVYVDWVSGTLVGRSEFNQGGKIHSESEWHCFLGYLVTWPRTSTASDCSFFGELILSV